MYFSLYPFTCIIITPDGRELEHLLLKMIERHELKNKAGAYIHVEEEYASYSPDALHSVGIQILSLGAHVHVQCRFRLICIQAF